MKNILITGGAGFIGSNLCLKLIEKGYQITVLDNLSPQIHGEASSSVLYQSIKDKVNFVNGDVANKADWEKVLPQQDAVIHLAAETGTGQSMYEITRYFDVNVTGTAHLLDYLANNSSHQVKKVVIASSRAVYGEGKYIDENTGEIHYPENRKEKDLDAGLFNPISEKTGHTLKVVATDETSQIQPNSIYGLTKYNQERAILITCQSLNIDVVALRYQNVYGPGQSLKNPYTGILSIFSTRIRTKKSINIFEDGLESRDFVYIDDVVEATIRSLENKKANNMAINVGTGIATTVIDVVKNLMKNYGIETEYFVSGQYRKGDIRHNFADLNLLEKTLGFTPSIGFEEGIKKFTDWVLEQELVEDKYEASLQELKEKGLFK